MEDNRSLIVENIADAVENDETVLNLAKDFLAMQHVYSAGIKEIQTKLEILDEEFHVKYDYNPIHSIESRLKSPKSLYNKMKKKNVIRKKRKKNKKIKKIRMKKEETNKRKNLIKERLKDYLIIFF